jgi:DNA-binding transcriptional MerR regulator
MSNIIELSAFKGPRSPRSVLHSENDECIEPSATGRPYRRSGRNMHTFVFRSYNMIVQSEEADLVRDVCLDVDKAQTKLKAVRRQLQRDREHAAARAELLTSVENKLSAAIEAAAVQTPVQPPAQGRPVAQRREFNEAMRRRINIVALLRNLSVEQIKPVLTLKHHEIAKFTERHGVNPEWLFEGKGPVFKNAPPNSVMSGAEFAAVLRTLPEAEQRKIEAVVDLFLLENRNR